MLTVGAASGSGSSPVSDTETSSPMAQVRPELAHSNLVISRLASERGKAEPPTFNVRSAMVSSVAVGLNARNKSPPRAEEELGDAIAGVVVLERIVGQAVATPRG